MTTTLTPAPLTPDELVELSRVRMLCLSGRARSRRIEAELSLTSVAQAIGVDVSTVSKWESAQRRPSGRKGLEYARLLDRLKEEVLG